jgi:WD40 repeat protein
MGKATKVVGAIAVFVVGGCTGGAPARDGLKGGVGGAAGSMPSAAGGDGAPAGAGSGGHAGSPSTRPAMACGPLMFVAPLTLAPPAAGQAYTRCGTLGPEADWRVTLAPSGNRLAALTGAGTVRLIATDSWTDVAQLASPLGRMDAVTFSPDGAALATLSSEMGQVALWRTSDGMLLRAFAGPPISGVEGISAALAFSSDGRRLATSLGTVIDLQTGVSTSWLTGAISTVVLGTNPENVNADSPTGGSVSFIRFTAGDARLLILTVYEIGNSPTTARLELRDPATGQAVVRMFEMYERALLGFALSRDGSRVAVGKDAEAEVGGFTPGLSVFDATTGAQVAFDATFTGRVLGFSPDGAVLYTRTGTTISAVASSDLHPIGQLSWPAEVIFLGVSPSGELVGSVGGVTSWWDPTTGEVLRTESFPLTAVTWSDDGRFGAGTGDAASLFHFWREVDGAQLCAPAADTTTAPPLASLGTVGPTSAPGSVTSADGSVTITASFVVHTHATDYDALAVTETATGTLLRQFGATVGVEPIAISTPGGERLYTPEGPDIAVWCR